MMRHPTSPISKSFSVFSQYHKHSEQAIQQRITNMGNCLRHESPVQWAGEDWSSLAPSNHFSGDSHLEFSSNKAMKVEEENLLLTENAGFSSSSSSSSSAASKSTEVKVKITKKQLEELLGMADVQGLTVHQILQHLVNASDWFETHQRSWRPALQSIPEVN